MSSTPSWPGLGGGNLPKVSSQISFTKGELENAGKKVTDGTGFIQALADKSQHLPVGFPHFGVAGWGLQNVHQDLIEAQKTALEKAKKALESWEPALRDADRNYVKADDGDKLGGGGPDLRGMGGRGLGDLGGGPGGPGGLSGLGSDLPGSGLPGPDLPGSDLPGSDLPGADLPGSDLPGSDLPGSDLPGSDLPGSDVPDSDLPGSDLPGSDLPGADLPKPDLPNSDLPGTDLPKPDLPNADLPRPGTDPADMKVPSIDSALNNPNRTDLSSYQPPTPHVGNIPSTSTNIPSVSDAGIRTGPGTMTGGGVGTGPGGNAGLQPGAAGLRGAGVPGMSGMPMAPIMPMGGAGKEERLSEKTVGLPEDESVWVGEDDIAPQVIGAEDL